MAGVLFVLFTAFFWLLQKKNEGRMKTGKDPSIVRVVKSAFFSKMHLSAYPVLIIILVIYFAPQLSNFRETDYFRKKYEMGQLGLDQFQANLIGPLKKASQIYTTIEDDKVYHILHDPLWEYMISLKEVIVKSDFGSNPESVEKNFKIMNWKSERFIEGGNFESITNIVISGEKFSPLRFKLWLGSKVIAESDSILSSDSEIYAKPPNKVDNTDIANYYGRKVEYKSKPSTNREIVLFLNEEDFDENHSSVITIVTRSKQNVPYSIYYEFAVRYKLGIDHFELISHYRSELKDYKLGWYDPDRREISWMDKPDAVNVEETVGNWGIEKEQQPIERWTYSIELSSKFERNLLFQYRQAWNRMVNPSDSSTTSK